MEFEMKPVAVCRQITSMDPGCWEGQVSELKASSLADVIAMAGNPLQNIDVLKEVKL